MAFHERTILRIGSFSPTKTPPLSPRRIRMMDAERIPEDISKVAKRLAECWGPTKDSFELGDAIASAILAERERCAGIADMWRNRDTGRAIADAIRGDP
jgi:hypothetical protein